jgi:hypothetical protein
LVSATAKKGEGIFEPIINDQSPRREVEFTPGLCCPPFKWEVAVEVAELS